jgi:hypothetical protein
VYYKESLLILIINQRREEILSTSQKRTREYD